MPGQTPGRRRRRRRRRCQDENTSSGRGRMWWEGHTPKTPKSETETQNGKQSAPNHAPQTLLLNIDLFTGHGKHPRFLAESRNFLEDQWIGRTMSDQQVLRGYHYLPFFIDGKVIRAAPKSHFFSREESPTSHSPSLFNNKLGLLLFLVCLLLVFPSFLLTIWIPQKAQKVIDF